MNQYSEWCSETNWQPVQIFCDRCWYDPVIHNNTQWLLHLGNGPENSAGPKAIPQSAWPQSRLDTIKSWFIHAPWRRTKPPTVGISNCKPILSGLVQLHPGPVASQSCSNTVTDQQHLSLVWPEPSSIPLPTPRTYSGLLQNHLTHL